MKPLQAAEKLFFPPRCPHCGEVLGFLPRCETCAETVESLRLPQKGRLSSRWHKMEYISEIYAVFSYEPPVETALWRFKFSGEQYLAQPFAREMAALARQEEPDAIVPVPASRRERRRHQGCHGAFLLAKELSRETGLPLWDKVLEKQFETLPQHELGVLRRSGNLAGSMRVRQPERLPDKTILLTDDIVTTGNTLDYCAKLCLAYGARRVIGISYAASLCREEREQWMKNKDRETKKGESGYGAE